MDKQTKVLFLDDNINRHQLKINQKEDDEYLVRVWSAQECIDHLSEEIWDLVCLDHDLEGTYQNPLDKNTGSEVVRWIVENNPEIGEIVVHSWNHREAPKMVKSLKSAGYSASWEPFPV